MLIKSLNAMYLSGRRTHPVKASPDAYRKRGFRSGSTMLSTAGIVFVQFAIAALALRPPAKVVGGRTVGGRRSWPDEAPAAATLPTR